MFVFLILVLFGTIVVSGNAKSTSDLPIITNQDGRGTEVVQTSSFSNGSVVTELQHTICSVKTEDVIAKAQSTASRILTGVCSSEEMARSFANIEKTIMERFEWLRRDLTKLIESKFPPPVAPKKNVKNNKPSPFRTVDVEYIFDERVFKNFT